ncbi:MAG TPA: DNA translocase FtsK [Candidatus Paceibacterota bacterium]|nr:DNA translocase FtsK [Candidatus Paceibacterota bacterium]
MARKHNRQNKPSLNPLTALPPATLRAIVAVVFAIVGVFLTLAAFDGAGEAGTSAYNLFAYLLGIGYFLLPLLSFVLAAAALREQEGSGVPLLKVLASAIFFVAGLGFVTIVSGKGGFVGAHIADPLVGLFDVYAAVSVLGGLSLISLLILVEGNISLAPLRALWSLLMRLFKKGSDDAAKDALITGADMGGDETPARASAHEEPPAQDYDEEPVIAKAPARAAAHDARIANAAALQTLLGEYQPPPLSLLERDKGRPGVGDIKGNANIIKRTLQNFGITVELDEISIGPSVTRYAIKPAEGVRLQKILSLQTNLELALAAHPVRIEAPIPGKSLVGIEVPNSAKVTVGLGTLLESPEFASSRKPLLVALGRDIAGSSHFANVAKMPHALIAGATGSGKSVTIHAIIASLLFRMGPSRLRFLMIDPKRVELTLYNPIPHLLSPVITDAKRAITALRWAGKEMERRYNILEEHRVRDIDSYHENVLAPALEALRKKGGAPDEGEKVPEGMPYIVIVIDELADIMQSYPRELEGAIVRLAQMSRAVGIHLLLSTQRPSVNVITGLIKANIPARLALQVASQIDSRTILDQGGAEKLLGAGDMLYLSGDMGKPVRLQSAFISEGEVKKVVDFIAKNNEAEIPVDIGAPAPGTTSLSLDGAGSSGGGFGGDDEEIDDDMYEAARAAVLEAGKASTSYLQRKLRVGYARAARLIDILEERGVIGPGDGAKPREILGMKPAEAPPPPEEV